MGYTRLAGVLVIALGALCVPLLAQVGEYALVLRDPPVAARALSRQDLRSAAARDRMARIQTAQASVRRQIESLGVRITGDSQVLVNAIFVHAGREQAEALKALPGVVRVEYLPPIRKHLDRAVDVVHARDAWSAAGGAQKAGLAVRIGILDSGRSPAICRTNRPSGRATPTRRSSWRAATWPSCPGPRSIRRIPARMTPLRATAPATARLWP